MSDQMSNPPALLALTARIVAAHVGHNSVTPEALTALIRSVHQTLANIGIEPAQPNKPVPAVPVKKSIFPEYLICLEDGKKLKMLRRHLKTSYNMSPEQYREKWGLPPEYPMVAPTYASHRSTLAKKIGLGRRRDLPEEIVVEKPAAKPGRKPGRKAAH